MALPDRDYLTVIQAMNKARLELPDDLDARLGFIDLTWCFETQMETLMASSHIGEAHYLLTILTAKLIALTRTQLLTSGGITVSDLVFGSVITLVPTVGYSYKEWKDEGIFWRLIVTKTLLSTCKKTGPVLLISVYFETCTPTRARSRCITLRRRFSHGKMQCTNQFARLRTMFTCSNASPIFRAAANDDAKEISRLLATGEATVSDRDEDGSLPIAVSLIFRITITTC